VVFVVVLVCIVLVVWATAGAATRPRAVRGAINAFIGSSSSFPV
jgi:hypothetical protein